MLAQYTIHHNATPPWQRALLIALPLVTLLAYLPAIRGGFIWDDDRHVSQNHTLLNLHGLEHIWFHPSYLPQYYPLTHTTWWLEYRLWGLDPLGYHIDNVLLHIVNSLLLWRLLKRLNICGAALAATIFALHPIEVESVAWISERKNLLSTFFALLSTLAYLRNNHRRWPLGSFLLFVAAMLSKTVACTLPAVFLVILWWKRGRVRLADVIELLPFFAVSVGLGGFTAHTEVNYVGATGPDWNLSHIQRCLIASRAVWFYLAKMFCPANLTFSYPRWAIHAHDIRLFLFPASVMLLVTSAWLLRNRIGRGPLAALLIFIGVLTPALGFFNTYPMRYSFVADHFQYTAGIAIIVLFSGTVVRILPQRLLVPIVGVVLAFLTWRQSQVYAGPQTLWRDVLAKNSSSWLADENLAVIFTYKPNPTRPELEEALQLYQRVQQLRPTHEKLQINWAEAFFKLGRWDEALSHYRLVTNSPGVNMNIVDDRMGIALLHLNRLDEADLIFQDALKKNGSDNDAECGLADVLAAQGHAADALAGYAGVLRHDADMAAAYRGSALALIELNRPTDAAARLERYLALVPNDAAAHEILARLDLELAKPSDAIKQFAVALALNPQSEAAKNGLADAINAQAKLAK